VIWTDLGEDSSLEPLKSQVQIYLDLMLELVAADPLNSKQSKNNLRDIETIRHRFTHEGVSFLTKTLPSLGKALDRGLETSRFTIPFGFRAKKNWSTPAFMQEYFNRVFDSLGFLREDADSSCICHIRQICFFAYKLSLPYAKSDESVVLDTFVSVEDEMPSSFDWDATLRVASFITEDVFRGFDPRNIIPRHGPGAVATGERLEQKWEFSRLYDKIHQVYPYYEYFIVGGARELMDRYDWYKSLQRDQEPRAKVVLVPKDSRGPRLISAEPLEFQWIEQGLGRKIMSHLESNQLTGGNINFTSQSINQQLAMSSSLTGEYATLDLKDASDRVSLALVKKVFAKTPDLLRALEACRTDSTLLPDGRIVSLKKYAPMGSALCFPIEAYIFWVLLVAGMSLRLGVRPAQVGKLIYVYGDDIIVPTYMAEDCIQELQKYYLIVNTSKSCIQGLFRESCGTDAFKGVNVTPSRLRTLWSGNRTDGSAYAAYISLANALEFKGYTQCSQFIWKELERTYGKIPYGVSNTPFPCRLVHSSSRAILLNKKNFRFRWNGDCQIIEFSVRRLKSSKVDTKLDGWTRVMRNMVSQRLDEPGSVVLPRSTKIKRGWSRVA
jgi:hypothetical protein